MNRSERHISFDYSYFIAIAGIGGLFCCAALMVGFAYGQPSFGYYAASVVLVITAFILLIPLAITSTKRMMQRLKRNWQRVHRLVYPAAGLAAVHFLWLVKADLLEPMIYLSVLLVLLGYRVWRYWQKRTKIEHAVAIVLSSER